MSRMPAATVADLMDTTLHTADGSESMRLAATMMAEDRVGSTLVMADGRLFGILTAHDVVKALSQSQDALTDPIERWMTRDPQTISRDGSPEEALRLMIAGNFQHLPVIDQSGRVAGTLSIRDLARSCLGRPQVGREQGEPQLRPQP